MVDRHGLSVDIVKESILRLSFVRKGFEYRINLIWSHKSKVAKHEQYESFSLVYRQENKYIIPNTFINLFVSYMKTAYKELKNEVLAADIRYKTKTTISTFLKTKPKQSVSTMSLIELNLKQTYTNEQMGFIFGRLCPRYLPTNRHNSAARYLFVRTMIMYSAVLEQYINFSGYQVLAMF